MAVTQISDIVVPSVFQPYMQERTAEVSRLFQSGAIQQTEAFNERAREKGEIIHLPFFKDLGRGDLSSGWDSQAHTDDSDIATQKRTTGEQKATKQRRAQAWAAADLTDTVSGELTLENVGDLVAAYWADDIQLAALFMLTGIFKASGPLGSNATDPHFVDVGAADGEADSNRTTIDGDNSDGKPLLDAMNKLGDRWDRIAVIAMHSKPFKDLQLANLIDFEPLSEQDIEIPRFMGREVIVDDSMPFTAGSDGTNPQDRYTTYLMGPGALAYGEGAPKNPSETNREPKTNGGQDELISRRHYVVHPNGLSYTGSIAGDTPTQSELETAADWSLEFEHKNVPIAAVEHN